MNFLVKKDDWRNVGVYCITNKINKKIYIGSTSTNFRHRYLQYCSGFKNSLDNQPVLYRAFRKYGFSEFEFTILAITEKDNCIKTEQFYIDKGTDYNSCLIAGSLLNFKHPETSKTRTVIGGKHHCAKKVDQYTMNGEFIKTFGSITDACKEIGKNKNISSHIVAVCNGKAISIGGYKWAFNGIKLKQRVDNRASSKSIDARGLKTKKQIIVLDLNTGIEKEFQSIKDMCLLYNIKTKSSVSNILRGGSKKLRNFNFKIKYKNNE